MVILTDEDIISYTEELLSDSAFIPVCPKIAQEIKQRMEDSRSNLRDVADLVEKDARLSGKITELMNSPVYCRTRGEIFSILKALQLMGLKDFYNIALTIFVRESMPKGVDRKLFEIFWEHSSTTAFICETLTDIKPEFAEYRDAAYMTGLFHDIGVPLLPQFFPDYKKLVLPALSLDPEVTATELRLHKTGHCAIGYVIAKRWKLPKAVCKAIISHHDIQISLHHSDDPFVDKLRAFLVLAEWIAEEYRDSEEPDKEEKDISFMTDALAELNLDLGTINRKKDEIVSILKQQTSAPEK